VLVLPKSLLTVEKLFKSDHNMAIKQQHWQIWPLKNRQCKHTYQSTNQSMHMVLWVTHIKWSTNYHTSFVSMVFSFRNTFPFHFKSESQSKVLWH
jgi:hypothetical protein